MRFHAKIRRATAGILFLFVLMGPASGKDQEWQAIYFNVGEFALSQQALEQVKSIATRALASPPYRVICTGHTDATGTVLENNILSLQRANAVKRAMLASGIPEEFILLIGKGASEPNVRQKSGHALAANRRVEIVIRWGDSEPID